MYEVPGVCIMIPTYNQSAYIARTVESAIAQDYPNLEIIVADDCSTDDTREKLKPFIEQNTIKYIRNERNLGRVGNYHHCLYDLATTEWVINLDGDDYYTNPSFISGAVNAIAKIGDQKVLFFQGSNIHKTGDIEVFQHPRMNSDQIEISGNEYFFKYFELRHFSHISILFNRKLAIQSGFYKKDIKSSDIFSFMQLCLNNGELKVIMSKKLSGVWLQHKANSSKTMEIKAHWVNYMLFKDLYEQALNRGFDKLQCFKWLMKARYYYLRNYVGSFIKKMLNKYFR